jgi:hypothetical protein
MFLCSGAIDTFIDDNKKLMRRMYGSLVQDEVVVETKPQGGEHNDINSPSKLVGKCIFYDQ